MYLRSCSIACVKISEAIGMYLVLFEFCFDAKNPGYDVYCHDQEADEEPSNLNHSLSLSLDLS